MDCSIDLRVGDTRVLVDELDDGSIDLVTGSPPFLNLRDYTDDERQIGGESDPAEFLTVLLELVGQWADKLTPTGSLAIELGDTLSGSAFRRSVFGAPDGDWPDAGSLCMIPEMFAGSLAFGRNLLTGQPSPAGRWLVRNKVTWWRSNPPTGSLGDRCRFASSLVTIATRSKNRWWDGTALRDANGSPALDGWPIETGEVWPIPRQPSPLPHSAQWPPELAKRLIEAMCPAKVCVECGEPRRRIEAVPDHIRRQNRERSGWASVDGREEVGEWSSTAFVAAVPVTTGWTDCECGAGWKPGVVLDPFTGSGTTLAVAEILGRSAIGFELDEAAAQLLPARTAECRRVLLGKTAGRTFSGKAPHGGQASLFAEAV